MMSNNDSFGGKLRKVLASMCSLFVGASGVSQANPLGTCINEPKFGQSAGVFGFGNIGWRALLKDGIKKEHSWLNVYGSVRYEQIVNANKDMGNVGFEMGDDCVFFSVWYYTKLANRICIPKGILFDVMRYFESKYFPNASVKEQVEKLSCAEGILDEKTKDEVFLRFILWAFCGSDNAIKPVGHDASFEELGEEIFGFVFGMNVTDRFVARITDKGKKYAVLKSGYFLENFNKRVREVYNDLGCDLADTNGMASLIGEINNDNMELQEKYAKVIEDKDKLQQKFNNLNKRTVELEQKLESLTAEKAELQNKYDQLGVAMKNLDEQRKQLNADKDGVQQKFKELENDKLKLQIGVLQLENADLKAKCGPLEEKKKDLDKQLNQLEEKKKDLDKQLNQLEEKKKVLDKQLSQLEEEKKGLKLQYEGENKNLKLQYEGENKNLKLQYEKEKKTLESQKRISCALVALGALVGGGALVEGTHRFFGAKRSGSSGKSKDKISSNGKNGQKARNNLKK